MMDLVRIYLGVALFFKGIYFMANPRCPASDHGEGGKVGPSPRRPSRITSCRHIWSAGCCWQSGLLTRFAAVAAASDSDRRRLLCASAGVHADEREPRQNLELSALVLFLTCLVCLHGSGRFSVDHLITKGEPQETPPVPKPA